MFRSRSTQSLSLLVTSILAGTGVVGCTKKADGSGSAPPVQDTSASLGAPDTPAPKPPVRKPVGHPVPMTRPDPKPTPSTPAQTLSYDPATNTATVELIAGPFTFNGYRNGEGTLVVPSKASVVINFVNKDGTPHSAIVVSGDGPIPNSATDPAIPRAYTNKVLEGLPQEATDVMRFAVPESGSYRIACGVPGHALSGMWIWLKVDPAAKAPSFGPTKG